MTSQCRATGPVAVVGYSPKARKTDHLIRERVQSSRTQLRLFCWEHNNQSSFIEAVAVAVESESSKPDTRNVAT
jgi:hypothetical protein